MAEILSDHGLEVIRKSGEIDPDKETYNYRIRVHDSAISQDINGTDYVRVWSPDVSTKTTIDTTTTTITTSITQIETPVGATNFSVWHETEGAILYIGDSDVATSNNLGLHPNDVLEVSEMGSSDDNELYAIAASGTALIYVAGAINQ